MRRCAIAATLLMTTSVSAFAQNIEPLREALNTLPEVLLTNPAAEQATFVNVAALRQLAEQRGATMDNDSLRRIRVGNIMRPVEALFAGGVDAWQAKSAIALDDVSYFVGFGEQPYSVTAWGVESEDKAQALIDSLLEQDFERLDGTDVVGNGAPLEIDFDKFDPTNPWRGGTGSATFATIKGTAVVQSSTPDLLPMMTNDGDSVGGNAVTAAALEGIAAAMADGQIVQAILISPVMGLGAADLSDLILPNADNIEAARESIEAKMEASMKGIPAYVGGLIVDAQLDAPALVIALVFPDCEIAESAAALMQQRWADSMPQTAQGQMTTGAVSSADGLCAATLTVETEQSDLANNPALDAMQDAYMRREFTVLQIGEPS